MTGKTLSETWTGLSLREVWGKFACSLKKTKPIQVNAFVLMKNHFHLLVSWNHSDVIRASEGVAAELDQTFGTETKIYPVKSFSNYLNVYKYIYRNPVEAGLVSLAEDYQYSSLRCVLGKSDLSFPVVDNMNVIHHPRILQWINADENLFRRICDDRSQP